MPPLLLQSCCILPALGQGCRQVTLVERPLIVGEAGHGLCGFCIEIVAAPVDGDLKMQRRLDTMLLDLGNFLNDDSEHGRRPAMPLLGRPGQKLQAEVKVDRLTIRPHQVYAAQLEKGIGLLEGGCSIK